jgi:hypothetical protein
MRRSTNSKLLPSENLRVVEAEAIQADADYQAACVAVDAARLAGGETLAHARAVRAKAYIFRANSILRAAKAKKKLRPDIHPEISNALAADSTLQKNECIEWAGTRNRNDYGFTRFLGVRQLAHRLAYAAAKAIRIEDIAGVVIRHECDNPRCIRPSHLLPGTQADNINDMYQRGRAVNSTARGSDSGTAKLNEADVIRIRARISAGDPRSAIAADYCVGKTQIARIARRESWGHV